MADTAQALAALRDADRFLHVSIQTYARELHEGQVARGGLKYASTNEEDAVVAQQEVGEALERIAAAIAALAEGAPRDALVAALRSDHVSQRLPPRVTALKRAVRSVYATLRATLPDAPALQVWGVDAQDEEIARAAGMGVRPLQVVAWTVGVAAVIAGLIWLAG